MSELTDRHVGLGDLWGRRAGLWREQLLAARSPPQRFDVLERLLRQRLVPAAVERAVVDDALIRFTAAPCLARVRDVGAASGLPPKRFIQVFHDFVGLTPKLFCRVLRFQAVVEQAANNRRVDWAQAALDCGYYDQSHLSFAISAGSPASRPRSTGRSNPAARITWRFHATTSKPIHERGEVVRNRLPGNFFNTRIRLRRMLMGETGRTPFTQDRGLMTEPESKPCRIDQVYPYLRTRDAAAAIEFYQRVFGVEELFRLTEPSGRVGHAELQFGPVVIMVSDEYPEMGILGPRSDGGNGVGIHLHVDDVDSLTQRAVDAGATLTMPPTDHFYGERSSKVVDPFGHEWMLGQHIEDVSPEEMQRRFTEMCQE